MLFQVDQNHDWVHDVTGLETRVSQPFDMLRFMFKDFS